MDNEITIILRDILKREPTTFDIDLYKNLLLHGITNKYLESGPALVDAINSVFKQLSWKAHNVS